MSHESTILLESDAAGAGERAGASVTFPESLPGLDGAQLWELLGHEAARPFLWMRSVDRPGLNLLVIDPRLVAPSYDPGIGSADLGRVGLRPGQKAVVLSVVTLDGDAAFANLLAPIIINPEELIGAQVILDDKEWPIRHPIMSDPVEVGGTRRSPKCSYSAENQDSRSSSGRKSG